jgi:hypothetical protein
MTGDTKHQSAREGCEQKVNVQVDQPGKAIIVWRTSMISSRNLQPKVLLRSQGRIAQVARFLSGVIIARILASSLLVGTQPSDSGFMAVRRFSHLDSCEIFVRYHVINELQSGRG